MLSIQQIQENNLVAKECLKALIEINQEYNNVKSARKREWEQASTTDKVFIALNSILSMNERNGEFISNSMLQGVERSLRFYFKMHYKYGESYSGRNSPKIEISWRTHGIIFDTRYTKKLFQVPHEIG